MLLQNQPFFTTEYLIEKLGPAPTVSQVARFLNETSSTTWRRLKNGYLKKIAGPGTARITLQSLSELLNNERHHEITHKRGKKPGENPRSKARSKVNP